MKITMNIPDDLLDRVDAYAKANYQTRTSLFCFAVNQYLISQQLPTLMENMNAAMKKIAATGSIDEEDRRSLAAWETFCQQLKP